MHTSKQILFNKRTSASATNFQKNCHPVTDWKENHQENSLAAIRLRSSVNTERRRRARTMVESFSRRGIEKGKKGRRRKVSMAEQARSIEYRLKRYRGSLRSPMRENRTTVGQLPVFSLHFCSIVSLTVSLFSSFLFSPPPLSLSVCLAVCVSKRNR